MRNTLLYFFVLATLCLPAAHASIIDQLQAAKKQLEDAKVQVVKGRQAIADAYDKINSKLINKLQDSLSSPESQKNAVLANKDLLEDILDKKMPEMLGIATGALVLVPLAVGVLGPIIAGIPVIELQLVDFPKVLGKIADTIDSVTDTMHNTINIIQPTLAGINPDPKNLAPAYQKFDTAIAKFDTAIKTLDKMISDIKEIEEDI